MANDENEIPTTIHFKRKRNEKAPKQQLIPVSPTEISMNVLIFMHLTRIEYHLICIIVETSNFARAIGWCLQTINSIDYSYPVFVPFFSAASLPYFESMRLVRLFFFLFLVRCFFYYLNNFSITSKWCFHLALTLHVVRFCVKCTKWW